MVCTAATNLRLKLIGKVRRDAGVCLLRTRMDGEFNQASAVVKELSLL